MLVVASERVLGRPRKSTGCPVFFGNRRLVGWPTDGHRLPLKASSTSKSRQVSCMKASWMILVMNL